MLGWIVILLIVALLVYIRLAPSDPVRWHRAAAISGTETKQMKGGYIWRKSVEGDGAAALQALDAVAMAAPRTQRLTGSVEARQITYVSRTALIGFPDYITATVTDAPGGGALIEVYGRLRFGRADLGVNARRIKEWVASAGL